MTLLTHILLPGIVTLFIFTEIIRLYLLRKNGDGAFGGLASLIAILWGIYICASYELQHTYHATFSETEPYTEWTLWMAVSALSAGLLFIVLSLLRFVLHRIPR